MPRMRDEANRNDFGEDSDLLNVNADVLFADPLGIRAGGKSGSGDQDHSQVRLSETSTKRRPEAEPTRPRRTLAELQPDQADVKAQDHVKHGGYPQKKNDKKPAQKEEPSQEKPSVTPVPVEKPLWQVWADKVWYVLPCSQRDREIPQDVRSGKAERPSFPPPDEDAARKQRMKEAEAELAEQDSDDDMAVTLQKASGSNQPPKKSAAQAPAESSKGKYRPEIEELMEPEVAHSGARSSEAPRKSEMGRLSMNCERGSHKPAHDHKGRPSLGPPAHRDMRLVKGWKWPKWAMDKRNPSIEVWVEDEDMLPQRGAWVKGRPQSIVLDDLKNHAFICAEYDWEGEEYVQDFGPEHVRHIGETITVFDTFAKGHDQDDMTGRKVQEHKTLQDHAGDLIEEGMDTGGGVTALLMRDSF